MERATESTSEYSKQEIERFMTHTPARTATANAETREPRRDGGDKNIADLSDLRSATRARF
jgi:hypothetical protein